MSTIELEKPKTHGNPGDGVVTWESLHPDLRKSIERGDADIAAGRGFTSGGVFREIDEWLGKG